MRRKAFLTMVALSLLVSGATGAWAAAAPFGSFDGFARGGNAANGVVAVQGWALAETGVLEVDIVVDGVIVGNANYGRSRPTVTKLHPGLHDSAAPGFGYQLDTTHFLNGMHTVTARVMSTTGQVVYLNSLQFQFANTNADLLPFGKIEFPNQQAELSGNGDGQPDLLGNCDVDNQTRQPIWSIVSGYALDVNAANNNPGVAYVELLIDGALTFNSQYDCHYEAQAGGLSDCYGLRRPDLEQVFPGLKDRVVIITGAGQGIGRVFAKAFALAGSRAVIACRKRRTHAGIHAAAQQDHGAAPVAGRVRFGEARYFTQVNHARFIILFNPKMFWLLPPRATLH